jgi:hypothetical protein
LLGIGLRMVLRRCRQLDRDAAALNPLRLLQSDTAAPYLDELRHIAREAFELMFAGAPAETEAATQRLATAQHLRKQNARELPNSTDPLSIPSCSSANSDASSLFRGISEFIPSAENRSFVDLEATKDDSDSMYAPSLSMTSTATPLKCATTDSARNIDALDAELNNSDTWQGRADVLQRAQRKYSADEVKETICASQYATIIVSTTLQELWMSCAVEESTSAKQMLADIHNVAPPPNVLRDAYAELLNLATKSDPRCRSLASAMVAVVLELKGAKGTTAVRSSVVRRLDGQKSQAARPWDGSAPLRQSAANDVNCVGYALTQLVSQYVLRRSACKNDYGAAAAFAAKKFIEYLRSEPELERYFDNRGLLQLHALADGPHASKLDAALAVVHHWLTFQPDRPSSAPPMNLKVRTLHRVDEVLDFVRRGRYVGIGVQSVSPRTDEVPYDLLTAHYVEEYELARKENREFAVSHGHMRVVQGVRRDSEGREWWHLRDTLLFDNQLDLLKSYGCNLVFNGKFVLAPSSPEELSKLELIMRLKYASFFVVLRADAT